MSSSGSKTALENAAIRPSWSFHRWPQMHLTTHLGRLEVGNLDVYYRYTYWSVDSHHLIDWRCMFRVKMTFNEPFLNY